MTFSHPFNSYQKLKHRHTRRRIHTKVQANRRTGYAVYPIKYAWVCFSVSEAEKFCKWIYSGYINILISVKNIVRTVCLNLLLLKPLYSGITGTTPWASWQIREIAGAHAPGMSGTFSPPPWVSDPDMHHGTCVTHVPWCMPGLLTSIFLWSRWRGKRHSQRMCNTQFYVSGKRSMLADRCTDHLHRRVISSSGGCVT